MNPTL